jgi:hypothetical protein
MCWNEDITWDNKKEKFAESKFPNYLRGIFLEIYKGQKVWQTYEFKNITRERYLAYDKFKKEECYFIWTEYHSINPIDYEDYSIKRKPITDISNTGYRNCILPTMSLALPDKQHDLHRYMIDLLSIHNKEAMNERESENDKWKKRNKNSKQQSLLLT